jgi:hypothetical protein
VYEANGVRGEATSRNDAGSIPEILIEIFYLLDFMQENISSFVT